MAQSRPVHSVLGPWGVLLEAQFLLRKEAASYTQCTCPGRHVVWGGRELPAPWSTPPAGAALGHAWRPGPWVMPQYPGRVLEPLPNRPTLLCTPIPRSLHGVLHAPLSHRTEHITRCHSPIIVAFVPCGVCAKRHTCQLVEPSGN